MLRRRPDDTFELRIVEQAIMALRPAPLSGERREALRLRIFSALGEQFSNDSLLGLRGGERWVAIPAGIGIAAAIFAAARLANPGYPETSSPRSTAELPDVALDSTELPAGEDFVALQPVYRTIGSDITVGMEAGTITTYVGPASGEGLLIRAGEIVIATKNARLEVSGAGWRAVVTEDSAATFQTSSAGTLIVVAEGHLLVSEADEPVVTLLRGATIFIVAPAPAPAASAVPREDSPADPAVVRNEAPERTTEAGGSSTLTSDEVTANIPFAAVAEHPQSTPPAKAASSPPASDLAVPVVPPSGSFPDWGEIPSESQGAGGPSIGPGEENPAANASGGDNGNGQANSNAGGNDNGNGQANSNAGGNGNGNGQANSNAGGNGNGDGQANSNAGGNGNGNGQANSNAGGNGNGNGQANSNAGGNGNGNGAEPANSNAGGNGKGNGQANSNAGGNGNGKGKE